MNFLAHFHLAWPDEYLVLGGLEGDFHKGALPGRLPQVLQDGVALHRAIDAYTDAHGKVAELRCSFPPELRRYAGILIDLCFDHFLTRHWETFSDIPLAPFKSGVYSMLSVHGHLLSAQAAHMAGRIKEYDILGRYHNWESVPNSAARVGQRFSRGNPLTDTASQLEPLLPVIEMAFLDFYPQLVQFCKNRRL
jgi:acyl carrier protein phosphodiesterase